MRGDQARKICLNEHSMMKCFFVLELMRFTALLVQCAGTQYNAQQIMLDSYSTVQDGNGA